MKWIFPYLVLSALMVCFTGCQQQLKSDGKTGQTLLFSIDFELNVPLKYNFVSERQMAVDLDPSGRGKKDTVQNTSEKLEMQMVYNPLELDPYGYSTIEATCKSVKVTRTQTSGRGQSRSDAAESLEGKSFTLKITPTGKIVDYSSLEKLIKEAGEKAFGGTQKGRVKNPDMIMDFVATQWYLWDSVSSIKKPLKGVKKGQKWHSQLSTPMPFVSKTARDVEYKFDGVVESNNISFAQISSVYKLSKTPAQAPLPYDGSFYMRGTFGFLRDYKVWGIEGSGRQLYDIERGVIKSDVQQYKTKVSASIFGLGSGTIEPNIEINQTVTMTLVE